MKVIYNRIIPFRGFKCINLFGILFVQKGCIMTRTDFNHESIHTAQMKELLLPSLLSAVCPGMVVPADTAPGQQKSIPRHIP